MLNNDTFSIPDAQITSDITTLRILYCVMQKWFPEKIPDKISLISE